MTEEETFNRLKRVPFEEISYFKKTISLLPWSDPADFVSDIRLEGTGWSKEEFLEELGRRYST